MKWKILIVLFCVFIVSITALFFKKPKQDILLNEQAQMELDQQVEEVQIESSHGETLEEKAYRIGYERGERAMLIQMGKFNYVKKVAKYTTDVEVPEEDKDKFNEIMSKAYVEGYHRAGEMFFCPRCQ